MLAPLLLSAGDDASRLHSLTTKVFCNCGCREILAECSHPECTAKSPMKQEIAFAVQNGRMDDEILSNLENEIRYEHSARTGLPWIQRSPLDRPARSRAHCLGNLYLAPSVRIFRDSKPMTGEASIRSRGTLAHFFTRRKVVICSSIALPASAVTFFPPTGWHDTLAYS